ncbi:MAG: hypothetical protein GKS06_08170 [Acidobacteria bacterium]|nr:hypothetical protein [Acidobacteriota bacterium]
MSGRMAWLERALRFACMLYPRKFRTLLAADMATLYVRETQRIAANAGAGHAYV